MASRVKPWQEGPYLFNKVPGIWGEVGGQHQLPLDDLIHGLFPVLCSEGWLEEAEGEGSLVASTRSCPCWEGALPHHPSPKEAGLADPVSMSYIRAPRLHQSTARLWPLRTRISGALGAGRNCQSGQAPLAILPTTGQPGATYMYSMVPQKV